MFIPEIGKTDLEEIGYSEREIAFLTSLPAKMPYDDLFSPPFKAVHLSTELFPDRELIALWERGCIICCYDRVTKEYVRFSVEEQNRCYPAGRSLCATVLAIVDQHIGELWDPDDPDDVEKMIRAGLDIARSIGFSFMDELEEYWRHGEELFVETELFQRISKQYH